MRPRGNAWIVVFSLACLAPHARAQVRKELKDDLADRWSVASRHVGEMHVQLAKRCTEKKLHEQARAELLRAVAIDATNSDAQRALGRKFDKGLWIEIPGAKSKKNEGSPAEVKLRAAEIADDRGVMTGKAIAMLEAVADWAEANGLKSDAQSIWERILRDYDPSYERALRATGWVLQDGRWVSPADQARRADGKKRVETALEGELVEDASPIERTMDWKLAKRRTPHFFLEGMHTDDEMRELVRTCEAARAATLEAFRLDANALPRPIHLVYLADRVHFGDYIDRGAGLADKEKPAYRRLGGFTTREKMEFVSWQGGSTLFYVRDLSVHMTSHLLLYQMTGLEKNPAWLMEGFAYWLSERLLSSARTQCIRFETAVDTDRGLYDVLDWRQELRDAVAEGKCPTLREVMLSEMSTLSTRKTIKAWSVASFLIAEHGDGFVEFLKALRGGASQEAALQKAFGGKGFAELDALWLASFDARK